VLYSKKISENQIIRLLDKGCTTNLKGFVLEDKKTEGLLRFDDDYNIKLEPKLKPTKETNKSTVSDKINCPKCSTGTILKGKTAYGCSNYKSGCDFVFTFDNIKKIANGKPLTKELVIKIISN
jgi:DNA topoisomerase-3